MKAWRESASLVIAAQNGLKCRQPYDYSLLFLKRSQTSKWSGSFVFPGGVIESADADLKWHDLYKKYGFNENRFQSLYPTTNYNRPQIFCSKKNELPREISLRISAIRETFEECGILICEQASTVSIKNSHFPISKDELEFWQDKVHHDANEFYRMCEKLECYPNLWALHEWHNWLTPANFPHRFNTAFFLTCLPQIPDTKLDLSELQDLIWESPGNVKKSLIHSLLPPQQYQIAEMLEHKSLESLYEYAVKKSKQGIMLHYFVRVLLNDGIAFLLPGDSMYPEKVDFYTDVEIDKSDMTLKEFRDISAVKRRAELPNEYSSSVLNIIHSKL